MPLFPVVRPRYIATLLGSALGALGLFYAGLFTLDATGNLPPPAFTNSICVDEKLAFHRQHPARDPNLLVIGSSVAWRHFDGAALVEEAPQVKPLNAGFCGLSASQSTFAAQWFLDRTPSVRDVLLITSPQDFETCGQAGVPLFNSEDVDRYVVGRASPWLYYLRYFDPFSLLRNATNIASKRRGDSINDPIVFDAYGSGPLRTDDVRDTQIYGLVRKLDGACFDAVRALNLRLKGEGRRLLVATTPLHPDWKHGTGAAPLLAEFNQRMQAALAVNPASEFWDGDAAGVVGRSAFFDAIHLRWSAARQYTRALGKALPPILPAFQLQAATP
ncbi:hypothetical protein [Teichococcus vastitatis]|nr:hypothetical protein [Pseudoroseomonas vastitatis]